MSLIFSAADMLPKIRLFEYQEESMKGETIAAISTAVSSSGIGIVRISGDQAFEIADRVYRSPKGKKKLSEQQSHTVHYGYICDGDEVLDEVLVVLMRAPRSFTAEDTVEIDCHGGVYAIQRVLEAVIKNGAAPAEPGEFTKRAFLNGRMDLSQAEAVMDVIEAKNEYALKSSVGQLRGSIGQKIKDLRAKIIYHIAYIESALDDPEHISLDGYPQELEKENEAWIEMIKEQVLFLPLDEHGKAVTGITVVSSPGGAEVAHCFDWEGTSIRPGDRCRLHKTGWVEGRIDLHIDALSLCSMLNCHCIGHPSYYKCPASSEIVPRKLRLGISGRCK